MIKKATFLGATTFLVAAALGAPGPVPPAPGPAPAPAPAPGYLTPAKAGFHHAALVYHEGRRRPAHLDALASLGFDAYVALRFVAPASGECTDYGATTAADWRGLLDAWFGDGGDLARLDAAVARAGKGPARVAVAVPWPSPEQPAFGPVEEGGRSLDFGRAQDRTTAVDWYAREVRARFDAAGYRQLRLWGLYFMREDATGGDPAWLPQATAAVRAHGLRTLWIPYADAPGVEESARLGFDAVVLQPSYAFTSPLDGGTTSASRLRATARRAQRLGLGVEIEARRGGTGEDGGRLLRQYLAEGTVQGYRGAATAWFTGWGDTVPWAPGSPVRQALADYLAGRPVRDDDLHPHWTWSPDRTVARAAFPARDGLRALRVDLEPGSAVSLVRVRTHAASGGRRDAGWAAVRPPEQVDEGAPSVAVPLEGRGGVDGLEVRFDRRVDAPVRMTGDAQWQWPPVRPPAASPPLYPDGGRLTDGAWAAGAWEPARSVGWSGWLDGARVAVDLGRSGPVSEVVVRTHGGGAAGVSWPDQPVVLVADCPVGNHAGAGVLPCPVTAVRAAPLEVTGGSHPALGGALRFRLPRGVRGRYVTVAVGGRGWLMLDEVSVRDAAGREVGLGAPYRVSPAPSGPDPEGGPYGEGARCPREGTGSL
ncbi:hypothetical protein GCM10010329_48530 [Streptomyces spiroverticillatus]|uniref:DUF4855 domain-containing protein n=1 Tax=Streptomyces finlayi TaxID=67296 RepID=A0A918X143_9ACTN|nr:DUF4855 domain-containing protein [Streptomyces finlayi]GHA19797.1 hypothetical protein GCM10010329_48530 [Streptomyces spiroverticillatus]GHD02662.1 hypothetical protein GCM10010334_49480 [Streptomyces finlayi]